jgi:hypothetical protein
VRRGALAALAPLLASLVFAGCSGCSKDKKGGAGGGAADARAAAAVLDAGAAVAAEEPDAGPPFPADMGSGFEGSVEMRIEPRGKPPVTVEVVIHGNRLSFDAPNRAMGEEARAIYDIALRRMVLVVREKMVYYVVDEKAPADADAGVMAATDAGGASALTPTGKKDKVGGVPCDVMEVRGARKAKTVACVADGIAFLDYGKLSNLAGTPPDWMRAMSGTKRFPARFVTTDEDADVLFKYEATFSKGPRAPMLFNPPASFARANQKLLGSAMKPGLPD